MDSRFSRNLRWFGRGLFAVLLIFEVLAWTAIIDVPLEFTWRGLVFTLVAVWLFLEVGSFMLRHKHLAPLHGGTYLFAAIVIFFDLLGDVRIFYSTYVWYDQVMHLCGGAVAAFVGWSLFKDILERDALKYHRWLPALLGFLTSAFAGVLYEIEEYLEDVFTGSHRLGSGFDTANDLLLNCIGALIIFIIAMIHKKRHD